MVCFLRRYVGSIPFLEEALAMGKSFGSIRLDRPLELKEEHNATIYRC